MWECVDSGRRERASGVSFFGMRHKDECIIYFHVEVESKFLSVSKNYHTIPVWYHASIDETHEMIEEGEI